MYSSSSTNNQTEKGRGFGDYIMLGKPETAAQCLGHFTEHTNTKNAPKFFTGLNVLSRLLMLVVWRVVNGICGVNQELCCSFSNVPTTSRLSLQALVIFLELIDLGNED
ncbi:unnamed protein product [Lepeophtheirus salmonis]|uniref:(salmon louse) hypothetical protein n=1 Tax=Lepeophtheirus salmonis TaxID=72036 RepID=A0A7R8D8E2_LEPSM|nr:unnamed protein product [Lepeophtheirus salmonis]CAF3007890.1 unnamed protein product [Lepeophtheirus salmonis]